MARIGDIVMMWIPKSGIHETGKPIKKVPVFYLVTQAHEDGSATVQTLRGDNEPQRIIRNFQTVHEALPVKDG